MKKNNFLILLIFVFVFIAFAFIKCNNNKKYKNIKISEAVEGQRYGPCEPSIFINPTNPKNIVAGTVLNEYHFSFDGGLTWETRTLKSKYGVWGDPCVVANNEGVFYFLHLSDVENKGWRSDSLLDRIVIQSSIDGGRTWDEGHYLGNNPPKQQDKEWIAISPIDNSMYVTWTQFDKYGSKDTINDFTNIMFSKSKDGGKTWTKSISINEFAGNCLDSDLTTEGAVPSVGINNEVYVAWSYNYKIYFDKSLDGGETWLDKDIVIANHVQGWDIEIPGINRTNGMPVTGVDLSNGSHRGTIYVNWADGVNGKDDIDIFLSKSKDGGKTWSSPIRVNKDKTNKHQFLTWMSVDPKTGYIYIVFYDRSKYDDNRTDVVLAVSQDGGETFTNETISETPFVPEEKAFFGDYNNISSFDGNIRPVWTRYENGKLSIWTALIKK